MTATLQDPGAVEALWDLRVHGTQAIAAAMAMTGLPAPLLHDAASVSAAVSPEVGRLLDSMEDLIRILPIALADRLERCVNTVRGPVVWSETIAARANALGNDDVFVCQTATRSFDCAENRLLVKVLHDVSRAGRALRGLLGDLVDPSEADRIRTRAAEAASWRQHRRLAELDPRDCSVRDLAQFRHGRHREDLTTLLAVRNRLHEPFTGADVAGLCDDRTLDWLGEVAGTLGEVARRTGAVAALELRGGELTCGPVAFRHPEAAPPGRPGLWVNEHRVDRW